MASKIMPSCPPPAEPAAADPMAQVSQVMTVVLYDPDTGNIAHVHQEATLAGGTPSSPAQVEAAAWRVLSRMRPSESTKLAALVLNTAARAAMCPGATYKVVNCALVQG